MFTAKTAGSYILPLDWNGDMENHLILIDYFRQSPSFTFLMCDKGVKVTFFQEHQPLATNTTNGIEFFEEFKKFRARNENYKVIPLKTPDFKIINYQWSESTEFTPLVMAKIIECRFAAITNLANDDKTFDIWLFKDLPGTGNYMAYGGVLEDFERLLAGFASSLMQALDKSYHADLFNTTQEWSYGFNAKETYNWDTVLPSRIEEQLKLWNYARFIGPDIDGKCCLILTDEVRNGPTSCRFARDTEFFRNWWHDVVTPLLQPLWNLRETTVDSHSTTYSLSQIMNMMKITRPDLDVETIRNLLEIKK